MSIALKQPDSAVQRELNELEQDVSVVVPFGSGSVRIGYLRNGTLRKITDVDFEADEFLRRCASRFERRTGESVLNEDGEVDRSKLSPRELRVARLKESQRISKVVAAILLNGYWRIKFFWWFKWRWLYYVVQCRDEDYRRVIEEAKKKVDYQAMGYYVNTILTTGMRDTVMAMTKEEAERFRRGLNGG